MKQALATLLPALGERSERRRRAPHGRGAGVLRGRRHEADGARGDAALARGAQAPAPLGARDPARAAPHAEADARRAARPRRGRRLLARARVRPAHHGGERVRHDRLREARALGRLRRELVPDAPRRPRARPRDPLPRRAALGGRVPRARSREPRGARRRARGERSRSRAPTRERAADRAPLHEGQPEPRARREPRDAASSSRPSAWWTAPPARTTWRRCARSRSAARPSSRAADVTKGTVLFRYLHLEVACRTVQTR